MANNNVKTMAQPIKCLRYEKDQGSIPGAQAGVVVHQQTQTDPWGL